MYNNILPYLKSLGSWPIFKPNAAIRDCTSLFCTTLDGIDSLTFTNLPLSGNAPCIFGFLYCLNADDAESPSKIARVQLLLSPLFFASINFTTFFLSKPLFNFLSLDLSSAACFCLIQSNTDWIISEFKTCLSVLSESTWILPKSLGSVINFSFVWDEKAGLIIVLLIKRYKWFFSSDGFTSTLCFLLILSLRNCVICQVMLSTCLPPSFVSTEFTNEIALNPEVEWPIPICQFSDCS